MPTTIALANYNDKLANELTARGFRVVAAASGHRTGQTTDAYLYTSYRPDSDCWFTVQPEHGDINLGNYHYTTVDHPTTIPLNITGLTADQIAEKLRHSLARRCRL